MLTAEKPMLTAQEAKAARVQRGTLVLTGEHDRIAAAKLWFEITWLLSLRVFRVRFLRSKLGIAWALLQPLIQAITLAFVFEKIFKISRVPHYPEYVLSGVMTWQCFQTGMVTATTAVIDNSPLVRKIAMPSVIFPISTVGAVLFVFAMQLVVLIGSAFVSETFSWKMFLMPIGIVLLFVLATALGVLFCAYQVAFRDVRFFVESGALIAYYVTPILYNPSTLPKVVQHFLLINPMYGIETIFRSSILAYNVDWGAIGSSTLGTVIVSVAAWFAFRSRSKDFADLA